MNSVQRAVPTQSCLLRAPTEHCSRGRACCSLESLSQRLSYVKPDMGHLCLVWEETQSTPRPQAWAPHCATDRSTSQRAQAPLPGHMVPPGLSVSVHRQEEEGKESKPKPEPRGSQARLVGPSAGLILVPCVASGRVQGR